MATVTVRLASRLFEREAKNRFDGDLNREISELITNSIDSYHRLIKKGIMQPDEERKVWVKLCKAQRKTSEKNTIQVIDNAEGMSRDTLMQIFGEKGANNNQGEDNETIRGLFGLGASDCMWASAIEGKSAEYYSFYEGELTRLKFDLAEEGNEIKITDIPIIGKNQIDNLRNKFGISNNGTVAIFGIPDSVTLDKDIDSFKHSLETIYLLRNLLMDDKNVVVLEAYGKSVTLSSKEYALTNPFLTKDNISFTYKGKEFKGKIDFYKNLDKVANPTEILVQDDRGNLYDNQMFGFAKSQGAEKLSGVLTLYGFWDLLNYFLEKRIALIKDDRTGFDVAKKFGKLLSESIAKPISEALSIILKEYGSQNISLSQTKNYKDFLKYLNKDLNSNRPLGDGDGKKPKEPPVNCIEFARGKASITAGHGYDLKVYINPEMLSENRTIELTAISNDGNIEIPEKIEIKEEDFGNKIIVKSLAISALKPTSLIPVIISAKYDIYSTTCELNVIEEEIIYPQNGIEFEKHQVTFTPDVNHRRIRLYFDKDKISETDVINITNDSNGKLKCSVQTVTIESGKMINEKIGYLELFFDGGDMKEHYSVVASYSGGNDKMEVDINASISNPRGNTGDISDYDIDATGYYTFIKSYRDPTTGKVLIVKGNPINDLFIGEYKESVSGKSLKYIISLVCYEAGKLHANREVSNGHIKKDDFETYQQHVEEKQKQYFEKYLALEKGEK